MSFVDAENNHYVSLSKGSGVSISGILTGESAQGSHSALNLSSHVGENAASINLGYFSPGSNSLLSPYTYISLDAQRIMGSTFYGDLDASTVWVDTINVGEESEDGKSKPMTITQSGITSDFFSANSGNFAVKPAASFEDKVDIKGNLKVTGDTEAKNVKITGNTNAQKVEIVDLVVSGSVNFTCGAGSQTGIYARFA